MVPEYMKLKINIKCNDPALYPQRVHESDAGADLRSSEDVEIYPGETKLVDTGVAIQIPYGMAGLVVPRSSMGKIRVMLANTVGVIDSDYRGNIKVLLANDGDDIFDIKAKDTRIAQLLIVPVLLAEFVKYTGDNWDNTARGVGGFGSTGV